MKKVFRFRDIEFWAEGGRVFVHNLTKAEDPSKHVLETVRSIEPTEFMKRALAVYRLHEEDKPSERWDVRQLMDAAEAVVKEALIQANKLGTNKVQVFIPSSGTQLLIPNRKPALKKESYDKILVDGYTIVDEAVI